MKAAGWVLKYVQELVLQKKKKLYLLPAGPNLEVSRSSKGSNVSFSSIITDCLPINSIHIFSRWRSKLGRISLSKGRSKFFCKTESHPFFSDILAQISPSLIVDTVMLLAGISNKLPNNEADSIFDAPPSLSKNPAKFVIHGVRFLMNSDNLSILGTPFGYLISIRSSLRVRDMRKCIRPTQMSIARLLSLKYLRILDWAEEDLAMLIQIGLTENDPGVFSHVTTSPFWRT
mmetsp:Transcript_14277/g.13785  ORF Transcript_14277/g.13785 Transcript_14277/m.13785 type:complete len:231 (+) Transcript_14277:690-1382(+)